MRKVIFWVHLFTGVVAGLVILVMSVTGVLLTYQRQITKWADGARVELSSGKDRLPLKELFAKLPANTNPPPTILLSSNPSIPVQLTYSRNEVVFLDPFTGNRIGEGSSRARNFFQLITDWHRWLAMSGDNRTTGKAITGACNLAFLFLVISGFYLWWPRNWNAKSLRAIIAIDRTLSGKARDWNWHNVFGFWSAIPLAVVVFTATFFSYPWMNDLLYRATGHQPPPKPPEQRSTAAKGDSANPGKRESKPQKAVWDNIDRPLAIAQSSNSKWKTISFRAPSSSSAPVVFTIDAGNGARPDLRSTITVNSATGEIEKSETYDSHVAPRKIRLWVRWLHTGEAGGILGQTIAGLASAAGAVLVWTGISLALKRLLKRGNASVPST